MYDSNSTFGAGHRIVVSNTPHMAAPVCVLMGGVMLELPVRATNVLCRLLHQRA